MNDYEWEHESLGRAAFAAVVAAGVDTDGATTWKAYFRPLVAPTWEEAVRADVLEVAAERDAAEAKLARLTELCDDSRSIVRTADVRAILQGDAT